MISFSRQKNNICSEIEEFYLYILKEKEIYHTLNMFKSQGVVEFASCWVPEKRYMETFMAIEELVKS